MLLSKHEASSSPFGWANGRRYILSVGSLARVHAYKGFDRVISTLPRLLTEIPDLQYAIIGAGDNQPCLEALAWQMGVHEKVTFIGRVSDQELANAFHGCDVFVMPSQASKSNGWWHGEGFGRVYVEAGLAGKPVVGGNSGGAAEAVLHGKTGLLVDPSSSEELVSALLRLLQNPDLAAQMGRAGRVWASENFTQRSLQASLRGLVEAFK
jgi:phosphatidylinositol alpha-1,6-mannosyltransferase